jgi:hypothetical protein
VIFINNVGDLNGMLENNKLDRKAVKHEFKEGFVIKINEKVLRKF